MVRKALGILIVPLAFVACEDNLTGVNNQTAQEPFEFAADASGATVLYLDAINSEITITGVGADDSVRVDGVREVRSNSTADAEERLDDLQVLWEVIGDTVYIETVQPVDTEGRTYQVDYNITLPRQFEVIVESANAAIEVASIDEDVYVEVGNGIVVLDDIEGEVFVDVGNGEVLGTVTLPTDGALDVGVGNGIIDIGIPTTTSAEFLANVGNGTISISNLTLQDQQSTNTRLSGRLGAGEGDIRLTVGNGTITVTGF
jgi:hypothetical protein